ncbi:MAG: molybdopterin-dependent oxidoreductase, partial [Myxococcales bacterium]|nr:molybdopterin-dependent oxidoreductase [Myxococcales bacterium]
MGEHHHYRVCPLCEATCGLELTLAAGQVTRVRGDADDVFSRGFICPKGAALGELHADPDRLRAPHVKTATGHVATTWEDALARVDAGLRGVLAAHGRDAVAVYLGNPNVHTLAGQLYVKALLRAHPTKNLYTASTVDQMPRHVSSGLLFGDPDAITVPDLDRADLLVVVGANPVVSNGSLCTAPDFPGRLKALRARGGRLVVVDPRRTRTADLADEHLVVRPGSDAWLLAAIVNVLFAEDRVRLGALEGRVTGVDAVRAFAAPFTPERVAARVGVPAERVRALARALSDAPRAAVYARLGSCTSRFGTVANWLVDVVNALTGNLDREGGAMFPRPFFRPVRERADTAGRGFRMGRWSSRVRGLPEVRRELPAATLVDEIETPGDGQVRALVSIAGNPALSLPGGERLGRALEGLDFMVAVDPYLNETTR